MSRFQGFLLTESRLKEINLDTLEKELTKGNYTNSYKRWQDNGGSYIYRGTRTAPADIAKGVGKAETPRKSANTRNWSTLFFDNHPMWSKFPKRSESFICSTDKDKAQNYSGYSGMVYHVFPKNGVDIGVCPTRDMFQSFERMSFNNSVAGINRFIDDTYDSALNRLDDDLGIIWDDDNWKDFVKNTKIIKNAYDEATTEEKKNFMSELLYYSFTERLKFDGDLMTILTKMYDPKKNGFKLVKAGADIPDLREVWISGECIFVSQKTVDEIGT